MAVALGFGACSIAFQVTIQIAFRTTSGIEEFAAVRTFNNTINIFRASLGVYGHWRKQLRDARQSGRDQADGDHV